MGSNILKSIYNQIFLCNSYRQFRFGIKIRFLQHILDMPKDDAEAEKLVRGAHLLEEAGCFGLVLEKIPAALAARVASE